MHFSNKYISKLLLLLKSKDTSPINAVAYPVTTWYNRKESLSEQLRFLSRAALSNCSETDTFLVYYIAVIHSHFDETVCPADSTFSQF